MNPQKLAGQCGKLKCCMNYELDSYVDALKDFPSKEINLETLDNTYYHFKTDTFKSAISYSTSQNFGANVVTISIERAKEIIALNKKGIKPDSLEDKTNEGEKKVDYNNVVGEDSLTRFDSQKKKKSGRRNRPVLKKNNQRNESSNQQKRNDKPSSN